MSTAPKSSSDQVNIVVFEPKKENHALRSNRVQIANVQLKLKNKKEGKLLALISTYVLNRTARSAAGMCE